LVDGLHYFRQCFADLRHRFGFIDLQASGTATAEAHLDADAFGFGQRNVLNEQRDHPFALDRRDPVVFGNSAVLPDVVFAA
jgi:hypothetical protein